MIGKHDDQNDEMTRRDEKDDPLVYNIAGREKRKMDRNARSKHPKERRLALDKRPVTASWWAVAMAARGRRRRRLVLLFLARLPAASVIFITGRPLATAPCAGARAAAARGGNRRRALLDTSSTTAGASPAAAHDGNRPWRRRRRAGAGDAAAIAG